MALNYPKKCPICGQHFISKRVHAQTCSSKCRYILHKINVQTKYFTKRNYCFIDLDELNPNQFKFENKIIWNKEMTDSFGNEFEFVKCYRDYCGKMIIALYRNNGAKYLELWKDYGDKVVVDIFNFEVGN